MAAFTFPIGLLSKKGGVVDNSFKLSIDTTLDVSNTFTWPLPSGQTYDFYWKPYPEATPLHVTAYNDANITYDYGAPFAGQIEALPGKMGGFSFNNGGDKLKVVSVDNWGDMAIDKCDYAFFGCLNLASIPNNSITWGNPSNFSGFFRKTPNLSVSIPSELLKLLVNATDFQQFFYLSGISGSLPVDLLRNNVLLTNLGNFLRESGVSGNIPNDFLRYNTLLTNVTYAFATGELEGGTLPNRLFYYNPFITSYSSAFRLVGNLTLGAEMFNLDEIYRVTDFVDFMRVSGTALSNTGTIQDIWNYALSATHTNVFTNQTAITNYADIPNDWKGL